MDFRIIALLLLFAACLRGQEDDEEGRIRAELQMMTYDLDDECTDRTKILKRYYLSPNEDNSNDKIASEIDEGRLLRAQALVMRKFEDDVPYELTRNWTLATKCGDALLSETQYQTLITFANENMQLSNGAITVKCVNDTEECTYTKRDVERELATSRDPERLKTVWSSWQRHAGAGFESYPSILALVNEAAAANDHADAKSYWETLADTPDAYTNAEVLWNEFEPLYAALHAFVLRRINHRYATNYTTIPAHLTGSALGDDWTALADIVLPRPQLYHDVDVELAAMDAQHLHRFAENLTRSIGFGSLSQHFWKHSDFTREACQPRVLTYCNEGTSEVLTCNRTDLRTYLEAHRTVMRIALDRFDYINLPQRNLRSSPVVEAVCELASLFGMNNLPYYDILPEAVFIQQEGGEANRMNALVLTALRLFPKIAYYYAADVWRLQELEEPSEDVVASWWEVRKKYQQVEGVDNREPDFITDETILYNKPYISKFLAMFLQFQFLNYHQLSFFRDTSNLATTFRKDSSFKEMLQNIVTKDAMELVSYYYSFDEVSSYPISDFFSGLTEFLEEAPLEQSPFTVKQPKFKKPEPVLKPKTKSRAKVKAVTTTTPQPAVTDAVTEMPTTPAVESTSKSEGVAKKAGNYAAVFIIFGTLGAIICACAWKRARRKRKGVVNRRPDA